MSFAGGILVAESGTRYVSSTAGMLCFINRLSGKRRHVRRSSGPGAGARAVEETQGREANDRGYEVGGIRAEDIGSPMAKSKFSYEDDVINKHHYHSPPHLHHLLHRHSHCQSCRRYHHRRDIDDDNGGSDDNDNKNDKDDGDEDETCLDCFHSRLHQRFYDRRSCRSNVNARLNHIDHVKVHRTETTTVHPFVRTSPTTTTSAATTTTTTTTTTSTTTTTTTTTTIAYPSVVTAVMRGCKIPPYLATILILSYTLFGIADACSSRSTPKPRPPTPTDRPNITFHMYTCPPDYAEWYCLNGATCFTVKIVDSLLYNCLCANGYIGQRCEFKDLDGSYLPSRQRVMLETASIAGGATIAVFLVVIICIAAYIHCKRKQKELRSSNSIDTVDCPGRDLELRPFSNRSRSLMIFMAKNPNSSATIEQTRMPGWNSPETESIRMASISENKHLSQ